MALGLDRTCWWRTRMAISALFRSITNFMNLVGALMTLRCSGAERLDVGNGMTSLPVLFAVSTPETN